MSSADGRIVGTTQIVDNGPATVRWNIAVMGDGYQEDQLDQYHSDVEEIVDAILAAAPFESLKGAINVFRVDVASTDSGAKDPTACGGNGASPRTYFDATFCGDDQLRRLLVVNNQTALEVASAQVPEFHVLIVIVNSTIEGGSGGPGPVAVLSASRMAADTALHELGHSAFGLADEYEYLAGCGFDPAGSHDHHPPGEPPEPNVTLDSSRGTIKWGGLIDPSTPMPTTANADCSECDRQPDPLPASTVGAFEGADHYHCGAYRPEFNCCMRALGPPFCAVCQAAIVRTLEPFVPGPDLCFIKTQNTSGGTVEVHISSASSGYGERVLEVSSDFKVADRSNGTWQLGGPIVNGWPTLYFVKTANCRSSRIEVHWSVYNPAAVAFRRVDDVPSWFVLANGRFGAWQVSFVPSVSNPLLFFVQDQSTPSGQVEVQAASGSSRYAQRLFDIASDFALEADGTWQMAPT